MIIWGAVFIVQVITKKPLWHKIIWAVVVVIIFSVVGCVTGCKTGNYPELIASLLSAISTTLLGIVTLIQADENSKITEKAEKKAFVIRNTPEIVLKQIQTGKMRDGATIVDFGVCDMVYRYVFSLCLEVLDLPILGFKIKEYSRIVNSGDKEEKKTYKVYMRQVGDNDISGYLRKNSEVRLWMPEIMSAEDNPYKFEIVFQYQNIYNQTFEKTVRFQYIDEATWSFNYIGEAIMVKDREI